VGAGLGLWAGSALADVPFYFVAATLKVAVWWTIPATLLIEAWVLHRLFAFDARRALGASLGVNAASAIAGVAAYLPILGALHHAFATPVGHWSKLAQDTLQLLALLVVIAPVDTLIEMLALQLMFKLRATRRQWAWFALTNLVTVGLCLGALAWGMVPRPASPAEQARIEQLYAQEIAWMRGLVQAWPDHVGRDAAQKLQTERPWSRARSEEARRMRFVALSYRGPAGAFYPVMREAERHRWQVVARSTRGGVVFERWEGERDEWLGRWRAKPPPRFGYEVFVDRSDGRWRVEAMFEAEPPAPATAPPSVPAPAPAPSASALPAHRGAGIR
jgi:hypothetical protein